MENRIRTAGRLLVLTTLPIFVVGAVYLNRDQHPFNFHGPLPLVKALLWLSFTLFAAYSGYCTLREDLPDTLREIVRFHFGRQICLDLYLGAGLMFLLMYLNEPTFLGFLLWMIPSLFYVNLLTLLYVAIHFDAIVARFIHVAG